MTAACHWGFAGSTAAKMAPDHTLHFITHHTNCSRHEEEKEQYQNVNIAVRPLTGILKTYLGGR